MNGCVLCARMRQGNSSVVVDASQEHNNGSIVGAVREWNVGMFFDGVDDYVSVQNSISLNSLTTEITVMAWIKPTAAGVSGTGVIVGRDYSGQRHFLFSLNDGKMDSVIGVASMVSADTTLTADVWQHVAFTFNTSTDELIYYLNGGKDGEINAAANLGTSNRALWIGAREWTGGELYFNGSIDEVRIYNRSLIADEILQQFTRSQYQRWMEAAAMSPA